MQTTIKGTCPTCNGAGRTDARNVQYKGVMAGYDLVTDTLPCRNCGGQYMFGQPTGEVKLREDSTPCVHVYKSNTVGRCLTEYKCIHCGDSYLIDSSD